MSEGGHGGGAAGGGTAVDFAYLEGFAAGDRKLIAEVLALFIGQAEVWAPRLTADDAGWRDVVHTIKGSGRGVGATALGEACARAEAAGPEGLVAVREALAAAVFEMRAYLAAG
jgi:HPt (histidine-containing phosphotransfer) domain-containing protein